MKGQEPDFSRVGRKKGRNRSNKILNILIGVVVLLIFITAWSILRGNDDGKPKESANPVSTDLDKDKTAEAKIDSDKDKSKEDSAASKDSQTEKDASEDKTKSDSRDDDGKTEESPGTVTYVPSDDNVISETIIDTAWQPIGTKQTGVHESLYDGKSIDWNEKKSALAYATGMSEDAMIFWKIKNGGGPQKSVGVVSSRDKAKKYRVYLEWIDGQGWKPTKMDVLTTLDFDY